MVLGGLHAELLLSKHATTVTEYKECSSRLASAVVTASFPCTPQVQGRHSTKITENASNIVCNETSSQMPEEMITLVKKHDRASATTTGSIAECKATCYYKGLANHDGFRCVWGGGGGEKPQPSEGTHSVTPCCDNIKETKSVLKVQIRLKQTLYPMLNIQMRG